MKRRHGFVSNSSSSSFIIGYGVIKDLTYFKKYCKDNGIDLEQYGIQLVDETDELRKVTEYGQWFILSCTNNIEIIIPKEYRESTWRYKNIVTVQVGNDEGDGAFWNEHSEEMDWDKADNIEYFPKDQQKLIRMLSEKDLFIASEVKIGAERNG